VVITGLSGGGRSEAANILEDLGWFVIDNLPPALMTKVSELAQAPGSSIAKVVLVVGTGPYHADVLPALATLRRQGSRLRIVFLEAIVVGYSPLGGAIGPVASSCARGRGRRNLHRRSTDDSGETTPV